MTVEFLNEKFNITEAYRIKKARLYLDVLQYFKVSNLVHYFIVS
jgi:hypothetical protein